MKNLILPFVVVALFAIGSCGDDATINPPEDKSKDTTNQIDTTKKDTTLKIIQIPSVQIEITQLSAVFEERYALERFYQTTTHEGDTNDIEKTIIYSDTLSHRWLWSQEGDTITIIQRNEEKSSNGDSIITERASVVLDTNSRVVKFFTLQSDFFFRPQNYNPHNYVETWKKQRRMITIADMLYTKTDTTITFLLRDNDILNKVSVFHWNDESYYFKIVGDNGATREEWTSSLFKNFVLPDSDTKIKITLRYYYKTL